MLLPTAGEVLNQSALITGVLAAALAVGAFIGRSQALLRNRPEPEIQRSTAIGGLQGLAIGLILVVLDSITG